MTSPRCGLSVAESGRTIPPAVLVSASARFRTTRSPRGTNFGSLPPFFAITPYSRIENAFGLTTRDEPPVDTIRCSHRERTARQTSELCEGHGDQGVTTRLQSG